MPRKKSLIVAANHASHFNSPIIAYAVARPISFLAKNTLFGLPLLGWLLKLSGSEPVHNHGLRPLLSRRATRKLNQGYVMALFLTGTPQNLVA